MDSVKALSWVFILCLASGAAEASDSYFPPPESQGGWRKLEQAEEIRRVARMDPDKLAALKQWLLDSDKRDFAAVVIRHGYIVLEVERGNSAKTDSRRVASVSKAICATVLAIASEQSQLGLTPKKMKFDDPAFNFILWAQPLSDPRKEKITVKQLLNHTSGICPEATGAPNDGSWEYILGHSGDKHTAQLAFDPGTACGYSTHALAHAALVCEMVTGMPYDQFAIQALFKPIGVEHWSFQFYDGGEKYGRHPSHGTGMPARELARIAFCMLRGGRWNDQQVIPKWFVDETAEPTHDVKTPEMRWKLNPQIFSHGWELPARLTGEGGRSGSGIPADARAKPGSGGQYIAFVPSLDLVITRQTGSSGEWQFEEYLRRACAAVSQIPQPTDAPKPMTPEQSAAAFKLPEGFRMEVVASEPLIASPSAVCWDERGRMFVSELHGYNLAGQLDIEELNKTGKLDTQVRRVQADEKFKRAAIAGTYGVVKLLRDTNGDGRMDVADVFATNLPPIYGLVPARGGVIVACAPDIVFLADRDNDGKAETREVLFTGFPTGELERGINAPQWGMDGWIYFGRGWGGGKITGPHLREPVQLPGSDFRIRADGSAIEPVTGATHTFGFAMTEAGDRFTVTTTVPGIFIAPLLWGYLARNPDAATPSLEAPTGDRRTYSISKPHPWRQKRADDPAYFNYYKSRYGAAESEATGWFTAACGPMIYQDRTLPGLHGQYFVCEPAGNLIHRALIEVDGSVLKLRRAPGEGKSEFAASIDAWSHPMNLTHGPDGCIWITDYYREIIEDYSAIPRHLQQQYGVYAGHDHGRIYRLTHRDACRTPPADMSALDAKALARECASPVLWRRQTAQRLLVERGDQSVAPALRELLTDTNSSALIGVLRTLDQLGALKPSDVQPFISHQEPAVRIHALQLADHRLVRDESLVRATLTAAASETNPRVQIQFALSLGETQDQRAFAMLAQFAREHLGVRWMDNALLSSLHGRELQMFAELAADNSALLPLLAQTITAHRDESELAGALKLVTSLKPATQTNVLNALVKGRKNAPRKPLADKSARSALATLTASSMAEVRAAARALEDSFVPTLADDEALVPAGQLPPVDQISDETFRKFVTALSAPRDLKHGHELFMQACTPCHRIGNEGSEVGPDLIGQLGMAEESLLKDILMPNEHIRPGFETTLVQTRDGGALTGLLKSDDATSLTLIQPGAVEQVLLRKDVVGVRRLATSLMPSYAEGLRPSDVADLLAWLRSNLGTTTVKPQNSK